MPSNVPVTVEVSYDPMKAPKTIKRAAFVTICLVGVVISVAIAYRALAPPKGLIVRLERLQSSAAVATTAEFKLSNLSSNSISGWHDAPQIRSNGKWKSHHWMSGNISGSGLAG